MKNLFEEIIREEAIRRYESEFKRKAERHQRTNLSFLIISFLFGIFFALVKITNIPANILHFTILDFISLLLSGSFLFVSLFYLMWVLWPVRYKYHPFPKEFEAQREKIILEYKKKGLLSNSLEEEIDKMVVDKSMVARFNEEIKHNYKLNNRKGDILFGAHIYSSISMFLLMVCILKQIIP